MKGSIQMTIDEYHDDPRYGSSVVKRALLHPARIDAPSGINPKVGAEGNRIHCGVIEPLDFPNRYCIAPNPDDYPEALRTSDDLRGALRDAGIKGYSGKKSAVLAEMVRESIPGAVLWSDILSEFGSASALKTWISQDEWDETQRTAEAVMAHPVVRDLGLFSEGIGEASFFADVTYRSPSIFGIEWPFKCRPDWLQSDRVSDLKTWAGGRPIDSFLSDANRYHYDLSAALYLDVLREHGHTSDRFSWVVVDKSTIRTGGRVLVHVVTLSPAFIAQGREKLAVALERIHEWETSPESYDRQTQIEHIAEPPAWGWR